MRYERVSGNDSDDTPISPANEQGQQPTPSSPPPSFRSRTSSTASRHHLLSSDPATTDAERTLHDTFDDGSDSDQEGGAGDDRQRLMRSTTLRSERNRTAQDGGRPDVLRTFTRFPGAGAPPSEGVPARPVFTANSGNRSYDRRNDGVFANLNAKPETGEKTEEQPPSYEAAAADAAPPYWENTVLAPGTISATDEVYVDGLPVGSVFSFVWNGMISMSFQFVGFLLTYLLHTTHAAKNGSRAGLGITLVQYGFYMRAAASKSSPSSSPNDPAFAAPADPNAHDINSNMQANNAAATIPPAADTVTVSGGGTDWLAYALMIVGWFILIRAVSDFIRARKHEQLVLQSPERGLNVPVVADNERPDTVV